MLSLQDTSSSELKARLREDSDQQLARYRMSIFHTPSSGSETTKSPEPFLRRWISTSKIPDSNSRSNRFSGSSKKFWSVRLSRLSTSRSSINVGTTDPGGTFLDPTHLRKRSQQFPPRRKNRFASVEGPDIPPIVKAAQAGSRSEVEAMLDKGDKIEACHIPTKRTALAVACHCGRTGMVEFLINRAAKLNTKDIDLSTPLHLAASRGHLGAVELLLQEPVKLEARDINKRTPLWLAAEGGHTSVAELLLKKGARIKTRAKDQLTPLHAAAKGGHRETVEILLDNHSHIESRDIDFMTALHHACDNGHLSVVDLLLQKGANVESIGKDSKLPLTFAAASGHLPIVELLSRKKASLESTDGKERNALHWAAANGHADVADFLWQQKLPLHAADAEGLTPIHLAVIGSHLSTVEFLLRKNAKLETRCRAGKTPIHFACDTDNADVVRLLLDAGANAEAETRPDSRRPIHIAAASGAVETIGVLYQHGVTMDARDSAGHRPLCVACYHGHVDVVKTFLSLKQPLTMPSRDGQRHDSPLCVAAKAGHLEVVALLIRRGALVNQKDEHGLTPFRYAAYHGQPEVMKLLLNAGAEPLDHGEDERGSLSLRDRIGFAEGIPEDRKQQVWVLLLALERSMSWRNEEALDQRPIQVSEVIAPATPQQASIPQLPEEKITIIETSEKEVFHDISPKSPISIFSTRSLKHLISPKISPPTSRPPSRELPPPPPSRLPPPPPSPPESRVSFLTRALGPQVPHLSALIQDGPPQISQRKSSLAPARSVPLPGGFTRDYSPNRMSHVGDLLVEKHIQSLKREAMYEMA
jgi:ankyrin repeat protein